MGKDDIAIAGYAVAALAYFGLAAVLVVVWRDRFSARALAGVAILSSIWSIALAVPSAGLAPFAGLYGAIEIVRDLAWITLALIILRELQRGSVARYDNLWLSLLVAVASIVVLLSAADTAAATLSAMTFEITALVLAFLAVTVVAQILRATASDGTSGIKYFCVAVAGMFLFDIAFFGVIVVNGQPGADLVAARGYVNGLFALLIAYSVHRRLRTTLENTVPRENVIGATWLMAVGASIAIFLAGDQFIRAAGSDWSDVLKVVGIVGILALLVMVLISPIMRARVRVALMKALFQYKYDYRREWLRFIATLSEPDRETVPTTAVRAVAQIVNSPAGIVWAQSQDDQEYVPIGSWRYELQNLSAVRRNSSLIEFLRDRQWIIDLNEMRNEPAVYKDLDLADLKDRQNDWWLIVPMMLGQRLSGFIVLLEPRLVPMLNFEDHDLLKTVGRHVATHIEQAEADRRLAEASQFGAYNRLTAFLMHDLNNLIAQQSMVVKNAERFGDNPDFFSDAIETIAHSVKRMRRLMEQLSSTSKPPVRRKVNVGEIIANTVERARTKSPRPNVSHCDDDLLVLADAERLSMVIEHLVSNAQEATDDGGTVDVRVQASGDSVTISIADTGCGMTESFIRNRLFRPFDSTKGSQSMGIGAYQARDYAATLGGKLQVTSESGNGTTFTLSLPLCK